MAGIAVACIRIPFNFTKGDAFDTMTLRFDTTTVSSPTNQRTENAHATSRVRRPGTRRRLSESGHECDGFEEIEISGFAPLLRRVGNVLGPSTA
jgi:hypothetical protein